MLICIGRECYAPCLVVFRTLFMLNRNSALIIHVTILYHLHEDDLKDLQECFRRGANIIGGCIKCPLCYHSTQVLVVLRRIYCDSTSIS